MGYFYPLLLYTALGGGLLLLGIASLSWLHTLHKPVTAASLLIATLLWLLLPAQGRWILSMWSPGSVMGGQILFDMTPAVWWCGLMFGAVFSGAAWIELSERRDTFPLVGPLMLAVLVLVWLSLSAGSLLTTLVIWSVSDLLWAATGLMSGAEGERLTFGLALHGASTIVLWTVSLILLREGGSGLWWLMWPSSPMLTLLLVAALMRVGFYPFQIVFPRKLGMTRSLSLLYLMGPMMGLSLLYRLMALPGVERLPDWVILWGVISLFWDALMAWSSRRQGLSMRAGHALLVGMVAGAIALESEAILVMGAATWMGCEVLLILARGRDENVIAWSWFSWIAVFFLLGIPPSPLGAILQSLFVFLSWPWRVVLLVGVGLVGALLLRCDGPPRTRNSVTPPWVWQRLALIAGFLIIVVTVVAVLLAFETVTFSWEGLGLWTIVVLLALTLARWGKTVRNGFKRARPLLGILDLQWLYRSMWRGAGHLLGVLRVSAGVLEGSGAVVWSLLILLLTLLVIVNR